MSAHSMIALPEPLVERVAKRANTAGLSTEQWIEFAVSERVRLEEETSEFFTARASMASGRSIREILKGVGENPVDAGDEL
jgi:acyl-CoA hydrolase